MDSITETLKADGVKPRKGRKWYGSHVWNILKQAERPGNGS